MFFGKRGAKRIFVGEYTGIPSVKPGLACLDSLYDYAHGELFVDQEEEYAQKILPVRTELAKMYVDQRSIKLDLYCIFRTVQLIFQIAIQKKRDFPYTKYEKQAAEKVYAKKEVTE